MDNYHLIKTVGLFRDINKDALTSVLGCIGADTRHVRKGETILRSGDKPQHVGVVLSGQLYVLREDIDGNRAVVAALNVGDIFAEALCCAGVEESPVSVIADTDAMVMQLRFSRILQVCSNTCVYHTKLIGNMLSLIAKKNIQLQNRMEIIGLKSIRAKVLRYLESLAVKQGWEITVPFNREELADFLCVERTALSHELARMKKEGLIEYRKNRFSLRYKAMLSI